MADEALAPRKQDASPKNDVDRRLSPKPSAGYIYQTSWPVPTGDIGGQLQLRLDGVARYIQEVGAERLRIERLPPAGPATPPEPSTEPFALPRLPESLPAVTVDHIFVDSLELGQELAGLEARC